MIFSAFYNNLHQFTTIPSSFRFNCTRPTVLNVGRARQGKCFANDSRRTENSWVDEHKWFCKGRKQSAGSRKGKGRPGEKGGRLGERSKVEDKEIRGT